MSSSHQISWEDSMIDHSVLLKPKSLFFFYFVFFNVKGHVSRRIWLHFMNPFCQGYIVSFAFCSKVFYGSTAYRSKT
jgi:hypothetical protein